MEKEPYNQRDHVHCFDQENPPCGIKLKDHKQCCLCELPMTTNDWEKKIREICTYSGDEGTSGYLLSEEQFEKIFDLLKERDLSLIAELEGMPDATGINAIPRTDDYAEGWNKCRKEAFESRKALKDLIITHLKEKTI